MYILADIGGTKMRIAGSSDLTKFDAPTIFETSQSYEQDLVLFSDTARKIASEENISAIAIGVPAVLSSDKRSILKSEHLPHWDGQNFADDLEKTLQTKVFLENDTALVGLGEAVYGAGKAVPIVVYITVSTGVNG